MTDERQIERIQALLAKAEATTHPAEAEAYMAKAQELMTKYAIDELMLTASGKKGSGEITTIEIIVPAPHADLKILGLHQLSFLHDCKVVMGGKQYKPGSNRRVVTGQRCWVTGHERDLERLEAVFASMSIQCTNEMLRANKGRTEVTEFRRAFTTGYFERIARRLREQQERTRQEQHFAESSLLPVLRDKAAQVEAAFNAKWAGDILRPGAQGQYGHGYNQGREAANRADLGNTRVGNTQRELS